MPKKSMDILTESMFYVLMAFSTGPMAGIEVVQFIKDRTKGRLQMGPATLYTLLAKFEKEKLIREILVDGRKRTYRITDKGRTVYRDELDRLMQCVQDATATEETNHERDN